MRGSLNGGAAALALACVLASACDDDDGGGNQTNQNNGNGNGNAAVCGDGAPEGSEECDDGAANSDVAPDACRSNCRLPHCGDAVTDSDEACDDGAANSDDLPNACRTTCERPGCGDHVVDTALGEACDNGPDVPTDTCDASCHVTTEYCGNGEVEASLGEECDEGSANGISPSPCRADCRNNSCGDGYVGGAEACDASVLNGVSPNACRDDCQVTWCGDGYVGGAEACDASDLNGVSPSACRADCQVTWCGDGYVGGAEACDASDLNGVSPNPCRAGCELTFCGDAYVGGTEACEDGNVLPWDGCDGCAISDVRVNSYTVVDQSEPAVAMSPSGRFVVLWASTNQDTAGYGVYGQRYGDDGLALGGEFRANDWVADSQHQPAAAISSDGTFLAAWYSSNQDGSGGGIYGQRFSASGALLGSEFRVNYSTAGMQYYPAAAMAGDGRFVIVWQDDRATSAPDIYARRFSAQGTALAQDLQINVYTTGVQETPAVAMADDGSFTVVWASDGPDGGGYGVRARMFAGNGTPLTSEIPVNVYTTGAQQSPAIGMTPDGKFVVVWASSGQDGDGWGVYARRFDGGWLGGDVSVNAYKTGNQDFPSVWVAGDGRFVIAWESQGQDGSGYGVYAQVYGADGAAQGSAQRVNRYTTGDQAAPAVAVGSDGRFVVVWQSPTQDGDGEGVFLQRFSSTRQPLGPAPW